MKITTTLLFILISTVAWSKKEVVDHFKKETDSLISLSSKLSEGSVFERDSFNTLYAQLLNKVISDKKSIGYDFKRLKNLSVITGPKDKFRVFTWLVPFNDGTYDYYGFTQYVKGKKKKKKVIVTKLENKGAKVMRPEFKKLKPTQWIGAVYYEIVIPKSKKDRNYVLLGWDGHNRRSSKKIIETISFNYKGTPTFGAPIFKVVDEFSKNNRIITQSRIIIEFTAKATINLSYDKHLKMIVFDHVAPTNPRLKGLKFTYAPDFSYDGLKYDDKKWIHKQDVDARSYDLVEPKKYNPKDYHKDKDSTKTTTPTNSN